MHTKLALAVSCVIVGGLLVAHAFNRRLAEYLAERFSVIEFVAMAALVVALICWLAARADQEGERRLRSRRWLRNRARRR